MASAVVAQPVPVVVQHGIQPVPAVMPEQIAPQSTLTTTTTTTTTTPMAVQDPRLQQHLRQLGALTQPEFEAAVAKVGPAEEALLAKLHGHVVTWPSEVALVEIARLFDFLDPNDDLQITRDEFKKMITRLDLHRPEGAAEGWKDDAFDKFDVDAQGAISPQEFNFAMAQTLFSFRAAGKTDMSALECFKHVLGITQEAQSAAKDAVEAVASGTKDEYAIDDKRHDLAVKAEVAELHARTARDEWNDSNCAVVTVALVPCYLCCTGYGCASLSGEKLDGLAAAVAYVCMTKEDNVTYKWTIQNYHYRTEHYTVTVSDGKGGSRTEHRTRQVRVNTHYAETRGVLGCTEHSGMYVPNMRKRNCVLSSDFTLGFTGDFGATYERRKQIFYRTNTTDVLQDKGCSHAIPSMKKSVRIEWAADGEEEPCYANGACMVLSVLTCTASCWFVKMRNFMCQNAFTFQKSAHAFIA